MNEYQLLLLNAILTDKKDEIQLRKKGFSKEDASDDRDAKGKKAIDDDILAQVIKKLETEKYDIEKILNAKYVAGKLYLHSKCLPNGAKYVNKEYLSLGICDKEPTIPVKQVACIFKNGNGDWAYISVELKKECQIFHSLMPQSIQDEIMKETCAILNKN